MLLPTTLLLFAVGASARSLPAPRSDFYFGANVSYHNVATLGPVPIVACHDSAAHFSMRTAMTGFSFPYLLFAIPRQAVEGAYKEQMELQSRTSLEYFNEPPFTTEPFYARMNDVQTQASSFLGCPGPTNGTLLMPSTTIGLNTVADGLVQSGWLSQGDRVLTTNQEHAGGLAGWLHYNTSGLIHVDMVPLPIPPYEPLTGVDQIVALFEKVITPQTKVLFFSHVTTTTGLALPVKALVELAKRQPHRPLVVVDGAQALGMGVNVSELGPPDAYATSMHKWGLSPTGNGLLCIAPRAAPYIHPVLLDGGTGAYTGSTGTRGAPTILGMGFAMTYLTSFDGGLAAVRAHNQALRAAALASLSGALGLTVVSPDPATAGPVLAAAPILTFGLPPPHTAKEVQLALWEQYRIVSKMTGSAVFPNEWPKNGHAPKEAIRLSYHVFNSHADVAFLEKALRDVLGL